MESETKERITLSAARIRLISNLNEARNTTQVEIQMTEHALWYWLLFSLKKSDIETASVLLGPQPILQRNNKYLVQVNDIIPGKHMICKKGSVTFTANTWAYWNRELFKRYPTGGSCILGYAHTHPRMPIFYSPDDEIVHRSSFRMQWQIGLVSDPHKPISTARFYGWSHNQGQLLDCNFLWPKFCDDFGTFNF